MSFNPSPRFSKTAVLILSLAFLAACPQSLPYTSRKITRELLTLHAALCPRVPFDMQRSKIVFFSDFHRGMGMTDEFKNNKKLFEQILNHYYENGYTLVLNGDMEEGWGYQRDNIPLILDEHRDEVEIEKKFLKDNRYYRTYGNHDDFYRGRPLVFDDGTWTRVYPAILFVQETDTGRPFSILVTHGCQGHGLHDAGDDVAAWGVSIKYLWLIETGMKNARTDPQAARRMDKAKKEYEKHEGYMLDWAFGDPGRSPCTLLVGGHTHNPVFESRFEPKMVSIVLRDYETGAKRAVSGPIEPEEAAAGAPSERGLAAPPKPPTAYELKMIETLKAMEAAPRAALQVESKTRALLELGPTYFNTGCGFFSQIPCLEISEGHIRIVYIKLDESGKPVFEVRGDANLEKYL